MTEEKVEQFPLKGEDEKDKPKANLSSSDNIGVSEDKKLPEAGSEEKIEPENEETAIDRLASMSSKELLEISMPTEEEQKESFFDNPRRAELGLWVCDKIKENKKVFSREIQERFRHSIQYVSQIMRDFVFFKFLKKVKEDGIVHYEFVLNGKNPVLEKYMLRMKKTLARKLIYEKSDRLAKLSDKK